MTVNMDSQVLFGRASLAFIGEVAWRAPWELGGAIIASSLKWIGVTIATYLSWQEYMLPVGLHILATFIFTIL